MLSVILYEYSYNVLFDELMKIDNVNDSKLLGKILEKSGILFGDTLILLMDERSEFDQFYCAVSLIDAAFDVECHHVFLDNGVDVSSVSAHEIAGELGIELE